MIHLVFAVLALPAAAADLPPLPGFPNSYPPVIAPSTPTASAAAPAPAPEPAKTEVAASTPTAPAAKPESPKTPLLMPPSIPSRPTGTLSTATAVADDLAARVRYFEDGQSYYRAYTKGGSHSAEENKAFVKFLEEYDNEQQIARKVHALLGVWLDKKSAVKD